MATLRSVYPAVELWQTTPADLLLLAGTQPVVYPAGELRRRVGPGAVPLGTARRLADQDLEGFLARYLGGPEFVARFIAQQPTRINSDDRNDVEYGCARMLGHHADSASQGATPSPKTSAPWPARAAAAGRRRRAGWSTGAAWGGSGAGCMPSRKAECPTTPR